eukprot:TRINITY_DN69514_c0_g1_i1.p1 TRINITY_DN69514_c0_g1~~TRINITY_DN69514_c0_g1_i1.p1  ORF type:complete len:299 (-),score=23.49 TRINITY_DN69514_c0_g1_i1:9-872(-)
MFVQILTPQEARKYPPFSIKGPDPAEFEIVTVIRKIKEVRPPPGKQFKEGDEFGCLCCKEHTMDLQVSLTPKWNYPEDEDGGKRETKTDTQKRVEVPKKKRGAKAEYNWRIIQPVVLPCKFHFLQINIWDCGILWGRTSIAENIFNLKSFFTKAHTGKGVNKGGGKDQQKGMVFVTKDEKGRPGPQWIDLKHPRTGDEIQAKVEIDMHIRPMEGENKRKLLLGREGWTGGHDPTGKPSWPPTDFYPWNPCGWAKYFAWKYKWKCYICCCSCLLIVLGIILLYFFVLK